MGVSVNENQWVCESCTYANNTATHKTRCEMCGTKKMNAGAKSANNSNNNSNSNSNINSNIRSYSANERINHNDTTVAVVNRTVESQQAKLQRQRPIKSSSQNQNQLQRKMFAKHALQSQSQELQIGMGNIKAVAEMKENVHANEQMQQQQHEHQQKRRQRMNNKQYAQLNDQIIALQSERDALVEQLQATREAGAQMDRYVQQLVGWYIFVCLFVTHPYKHMFIFTTDIATAAIASKPNATTKSIARK